MFYIVTNRDVAALPNFSFLKPSSLLFLPKSEFMFENKVVAITGGTDGIGKALVEAFLQKGAKVATCARTVQKLDEMKMAFAGKPLLTVVADVSKEADCKNFIEKTIEEYNGIDILINNAGISMRALFKDTDLATLKKVMDINFWGT